MVTIVKNSKPVVTDILCEFFEIAVHSILYTRKIYPETIFVKRKKYGIGIYQSIHPQLNEYINKTIQAIKYHIAVNQLQQLFVCIIKEKHIYERYVFDIIKLQHNLKNDPMLIKLEQGLRAFLLKLFVYSTSKPLSGDVSFILQMHISEYSSIAFNEEPVFEDFPWIEVNEENVTKHSLDIIPIYTVKTDNVNLQMYMECLGKK